MKLESHGEWIKPSGYDPQWNDVHSSRRADEFQLFKHSYISTACFHELHGDCRLMCKFCNEQCDCSCHEPANQQNT